jgi:hypothetical protein
MSQKLTFKTAATINATPTNQCPYTGKAPFTNAEYVRTCTALPSLCSCTYWDKPEVFNKCPTKQAEEDRLVT